MKKNQRSKLKINPVAANIEKAQSKASLPIVKCSCGAKILVVPDLAAMNRAVKSHMVEHEDANEQFLTQQILKAATKEFL
jgi:hypothetical protein